MPASGANAAAPAEPTDTAGDIAAVARAAKAHAKLIDDATDAAIQAGTLLPTAVPAFRAALRANDKAKAEALLCDVQALSMRSGASGAAAPVKGVTTKRSSGEIRAEVLARHGLREGGMVTRAAGSEILSEINKARAAGLLED